MPTKVEVGVELKFMEKVGQYNTKSSLWNKMREGEEVEREGMRERAYLVDLSLLS